MSNFGWRMKIHCNFYLHGMAVPFDCWLLHSTMPHSKSLTLQKKFLKGFNKCLYFGVDIWNIWCMCVCIYYYLLCYFRQY